MLKEIKDEIKFCLREEWEEELEITHIHFTDFMLDKFAHLFIKTCILTVAAFVAGIFAAYLVWGA